MVCIARGVSLVENGFAVELLFDPAMEARLRALWKALAQAEVSSSMLDIGARPHVSLAVFERLDPTSMHAELDGFARENPPLEVTLSAVGTFPGAEGAVFIAPVWWRREAGTSCNHHSSSVMSRAIFNVPALSLITVNDAELVTELHHHRRTPPQRHHQDIAPPP